MPELGIWYDGMHVDSLIGYFEPADREPHHGRRGVDPGHPVTQRPQEPAEPPLAAAQVQRSF